MQDQGDSSGPVGLGGSIGPGGRDGAGWRPGVGHGEDRPGDIWELDLDQVKRAPRVAPACGL